MNVEQDNAESSHKERKKVNVERYWMCFCVCVKMGAWEVVNSSIKNLVLGRQQSIEFEENKVQFGVGSKRSSLFFFRSFSRGFFCLKSNTRPLPTQITSAKAKLALKK